MTMCVQFTVCMMEAYSKTSFSSADKHVGCHLIGSTFLLRVHCFF